MKHVEKWLWKIRWAGRQTTSRVHYTEEKSAASTRGRSRRRQLDRGAPAETEAEVDAAQRPAHRAAGST